MVPQLFDKWREADAAARAAEKDVLTASLTALDGKGAPPSREARECAKNLRAYADDMLHGALVSLKTASEWPEKAAGEGLESAPPKSQAA